MELLNDMLSNNLMFLVDQLQQCTVSEKGWCYLTHQIHHAVNLYLSSHLSYGTLSNIQQMPCPKTLKFYLGRIGEVGTASECEAIIATNFSYLNDSQNKCLVLFNELHLKLSVRFCTRHLVGYSVDKPTFPGRSILALMVKPFYGGPAFTTGVP